MCSFDSILRHKANLGCHRSVNPRHLLWKLLLLGLLLLLLVVLDQRREEGRSGVDHAWHSSQLPLSGSISHLWGVLSTHVWQVAMIWARFDHPLHLEQMTERTWFRHDGAGDGHHGCTTIAKVSITILWGDWLWVLLMLLRLGGIIRAISTTSFISSCLILSIS